MTLLFLQLDPRDGKLDSIGKVREHIQLGEDFNTYVGDFETDVFLPDGTHIIHDGGRFEGKRVAVP